MSFLIPANAEEDENGEVEIQAYSFTETKTEQKTFNPEDSDAEWDMIEEVFNSYGGVNVRDRFSPTPKNQRGVGKSGGHFWPFTPEIKTASKSSGRF